MKKVDECENDEELVEQGLSEAFAAQDVQWKEMDQDSRHTKAKLETNLSNEDFSSLFLMSKNLVLCCK